MTQQVYVPLEADTAEREDMRQAGLAFLVTILALLILVHALRPRAREERHAHQD